MRPQRWLFVLLALALVAVITPVRAQEAKNNIVVVDPNKATPDSGLSEDELATIEQLQNGALTAVPFSPVSPDDQVVLFASDTQIGFLNIQDGSAVALNPESFGPLIPLPLFGFGSFNWLDNRTLVTLALDQTANDFADAFVRLTIDRETLRISGDRLRLPGNTALLSVSPDVSRFLLVVLPSQENESQRAAVRVQLGKTVPGLRQATPLPMPAVLQRRVEQFRHSRAALMDRLRLMQDGETNDGAVEATPQALDLLLYNADGRGSYLTTIPAASVSFGDVWTRDSSKVAFSFFGLPDLEGTRFGLDGALLSEEIYRDVTGNLAPSQNPILQNNTTYVVDATSGGVQLLRSGGGDAPPILSAAGWSPDNQTLLVEALFPARLKGRRYPIYVPQFSERSALRFYDANLRQVGQLESDLFSAPGALLSGINAQFVSPDELIIRAPRGTDRHPYYYNRASGELRDIADRAGSYYNVFATNRSRQIVFMHSSYTQPPELYRLGWDGRGLARLSWINEELRQFANLREDPVSVRLRNGQTRVGTLIQRADASFPPRGVPLVVWQEGGPGVAMVNRWAANVENPYALLPAFDLALLVMPLAGRPGYNPATFNALADNNNFGAIDIDEQAEVVRQLIAQGWTSPGRVGITGCSYGGYFVAQSVVRHPTLYAAANVQCGFVDMVTEWTRGFDALAPYLEGLPPYNNPEEYRRDSPAYNVGSIQTPLLTFHGSDDYLPIVQNENLHLQLVNRGVPARMLKFLGEGHGLSDPRNQFYAAQEQIGWFRTYLK